MEIMDRRAIPAAKAFVRAPRLDIVDLRAIVHIVRTWHAHLPKLKITMRHLGDKADVVREPISGDDIRTLREDSHLSQAVFPRYLNPTTGYVSQLERGAKRPTGPALVLLNVIRRKGIEAIP
jgi:DNA-binding transcriptional regulator YiaG